MRYLPDGEHLLAGTRYCAEVVLWTPYLSIADTSDASFSIFAPRKSVADIDFGRVPIDRRRDSTLDGYICNEGNRPMIVHEITFPDDDYADFSLRGNVTFPLTIAPGECRALVFSFEPRSDNPRSAIVRFVIDRDTLFAELRSQGFVTSGVE